MCTTTFSAPPMCIETIACTTWRRGLGLPGLTALTPTSGNHGAPRATRAQSSARGFS